MEFKTLRKLFIICVLTSGFFGCGGETPSISVQPSEEVFEQTGEPIVAKMNILWVIDNSGSMNNFQESVRQNILTFMENFTAKNYDFQMAVAATDAWRDLNIPDAGTGGQVSFDSSNYSRLKADSLGNRFVTGDTPDVVQRFDEMADVGTRGTGDERAFQSIEAVILNPENSNFFRPDAHFAIIIVSDEEDISRLNNTNCNGANQFYSEQDPLAGYVSDVCEPGLERVSYYHDLLQTNSDEVFGVSVHNMSISPGDQAPPGSSSTDCRTAILPGDSTRYLRYYGIRTNELATLTDGTISSLCSDFADSLNDIATTIIERTVEFPLDTIPSNPQEIYVGIKNPGDTDFTEIPNSAIDGWSYNSAANSIVFHGEAIPFQGAEISVIFDRDTL